LALNAQGKVVAGTIPNGKVFTIEGKGAAKELVSLPETEHVWALVLDPKTKAMFAATGPEGKLFRLANGAAAQVHFDSDEPHLISLVAAPDGTLYAGSSGSAILYKITGPGRATVLYDFAGTEVKALAMTRDGNLFAVVNEHMSPPSVPRSSQSNAGRSTDQSKQDTVVPRPGKGRLFRVTPSGSVEEMLYNSDTHFQSLAIGDDGLPYVGTAKDGQVYAVDDARTSMLMADTKERQVGAFVVAGRTKFIATSDPAYFRPIRSIGGQESVWNSAVQDAGLRATFGNLDWRSSGPIELSTRTGNTSKPDTSWSDWSNPLIAPGKIPSPPARYLQVRARFSRDPSAVLRDVTAYFVTDNARAIVTSVSAGESSSSGRSDSVPESGGPISEARTKIKLSWRVTNPDNDTLRFRLYYRFENSSVWRAILPSNEVLTRTSYDWETAGLPEGAFRVKVEASDELSNPPNLVLKHSLESGTVIIDNTPPVIEQLTVAGKRIQGRAVDGVGPIARIEVAVDPDQNQWFPYFPVDGIFDDKTERFDLDVSTLVSSVPVIVTVRVTDASGNRVVRAVEVR
ncbi:MAG: hypothetical protein FWD57_09290, partial [Polyangiaceae bacterium]|nr:hypothetical protein [Polyangiaceae bacterium]